MYRSNYFNFIRHKRLLVCLLRKYGLDILELDEIPFHGPLPEMPGFKIFFPFLYLPSYALLRVTICVFITVPQSKDSAVF